jgi:hypothetical protein
LVVALYAICTVLGVVALLTWITLGIAASAGDDRRYLDPELRFGERGRVVVAAVLGFGLAGMSASFAGWGNGLALLGAISGAIAAVLVGRYLGVEEDGDPA